MIQIDGSQGEGGGQILRSALTLAMLTGQTLRMVNIRAGRKKPGLRAQHLKAVEAAAAVSQAHVEGARPGSTALLFEPRDLCCGDYRFDIGTAGSTSLVLQTVLLPLAAAKGPSRITVTGGTHVLWSPCHHYLDLHWLPCLRRIGLEAGFHLERAGFYPRGGGCVSASIGPAVPRFPLRLLERGRLKRLLCLSAVANLPETIALRQSLQAQRRLVRCGINMEQKTVSLPACGQGTMLLLLAEFEQTHCCYFALGERGKPAERVADEAVDAFLAYLAAKAAVDEHLADQLLLPLALTPGRSELSTARVTQHLVTNAMVVKQFLPVSIVTEGDVGEPGLLRIEGMSLRDNKKGVILQNFPV